MSHLGRSRLWIFWDEEVRGRRFSIKWIIIRKAPFEIFQIPPKGYIAAIKTWLFRTDWINQEDFTRSGKERRPVLCLSLLDKSEYALFIANYRTELKFIIYNYGAELLFWAVISNYCGRVSQDKKPEMLGKSRGNWARLEKRNFTLCLTLMKPHMSGAI